MTTPASTTTNTSTPNVTRAGSAQGDPTSPSAAPLMAQIDKLEAALAQLREAVVAYDSQVQGGPVRRSTDASTSSTTVTRAPSTGGAAEAQRRFGGRA